MHYLYSILIPLQHEELVLIQQQRRIRSVSHNNDERMSLEEDEIQELTTEKKKHINNSTNTLRKIEYFLSIGLSADTKDKVCSIIIINMINLIIDCHCYCVTERKNSD